jgi:serine/threonine-protein kinase
VASKQVLETPIPPSKVNADVSPDLDAVILKALAKNPANRYQSAEELRVDLDRSRRGEPVLATPILAEPAPTQAMTPAAQTTAVLPPTQPSGGGRKWWVGVLVALLILGALGAGLYFLATGLLGENVKQVKVPSVTGFSQAQAESTLVNAGFVPKVDTKVVDDPAQVGLVQEQNPPANELADEGSDVTIVVGKAPRQVEVPDLTDMTVDEARTELDAVNLTLGTPTEQASTEVDIGHIISQDPLPLTPVNPGTPVNCVISTGPAMATVPDVVCFTLGQAKARIQDADLNPIVAPTTLPPNPQCPNGNKVVATDPVAPQQVQAGSDVLIYLPGEEASPTPSESPTP